MDIQMISEVARDNMAFRRSHLHKETGNKYAHGQRVARIAEQICDSISYHDNREVLIVTSWFHDISNGVENHEQLGAEAVRELLKGLCSSEELIAICDLISVHDSRELDNLSTEAKILQDVDLLDHYGTFEVWCLFRDAVNLDLSVSDTAEMMAKDYIRSFEANRDVLHFDFSVKVYDERREYVRRFVERMKIESNGGIISFDLKNE